MNLLLRKRPFMRTVPGWAIRSVLGDFSTVFLEGQKVAPSVLERLGFAFPFPAFREAAAELVGREGVRIVL